MYVIATAGHINHGKSTLVRALTGMEPDRWAEERRRGMTIDLGYAWTSVDGVGEIAFVDVPGHTKFVTNMLAGVGPVPAVLLVVAADRGWGRQSGEHLAALDALGVSHGILVITRSDLADPAVALGQARDHLAGTSLAGIDDVAVSAPTGVGLDEMRAALGRMAAGLAPPSSTAVRMWVDRVFTVTGAGTVVTGTLGSGTIRRGDELVIAASGRAVHVRGLEELGRAVDKASAVARVAVNLRGVGRSEIRRGDVLVTAGRWAAATEIDVRLRHAPDALPAEPILHIGSAATAVRVRRLGPDTARLRLRAPLPLHIGDRALLRDPGPEEIVAGVTVLDVYPPPLARRGAAAARAARLAELTGRPDPAGETRRRGLVSHETLVAAGHLEPGSAPPPDAVRVGGYLVDPGRWARWQGDLVAGVDAWAGAHPLDPGMPAGVIARRLELPDVRAVDALVRSVAGLVQVDGTVRRAALGPAVPPEIDAALDRLLRHLRAHPYSAADAADLAADGLTAAHLAVFVKAGRLIRVAPGIFLLPDAPERAADRLRELPQPFTTSDARVALATTRRVAVPLLELLDRLRWTRRLDAGTRVVQGVRAGPVDR